MTTVPLSFCRKASRCMTTERRNPKLPRNDPGTIGYEAGLPVVNGRELLRGDVIEIWDDQSRPGGGWVRASVGTEHTGGGELQWVLYVDRGTYSVRRELELEVGTPARWPERRFERPAAPRDRNPGPDLDR